MRRRRSRLDSRVVGPWLAGIVILAGMIWWFSWLMDVQRIERSGETDQIGNVVATQERFEVPGDENEEPIPIADLLPLGPEDIGFKVIVRGTVVGEPLDDGFWFLTDEDEVIFARQGHPAEAGQDLTLTGRLDRMPAAEGEKLANRARLREAAGWEVHHDIFLQVEIPTNLPHPVSIDSSQ